MHSCSSTSCSCHSPFSYPHSTPAGGDRDRAAGHEVAVDVGDDRVVADRRPLLDERAIAAQADVVAGGVDEQVGARRPRLAVDVLHRGLRRHRARQVDVGAIEVDLEIVRPGAVGAARVLLVLGACAGRALEARRLEVDHRRPGTNGNVAGEPPPGLPDAERVRVPVGRLVRRLLGRHQPVDGRVGQRPAGVVLGVDGDRGRFAGEVRPARLGAGRHRELGAPELLDLELVHRRRLAGARERQREVHVGGAEVGAVGEVDREVEAAERIERCRSGRQLDTLRVEHLIADVGDVLDQLQAGLVRPGQPAHPAGEAHGLARPVDAAVVEHVPARLVGRRRPRPRLVPPARQQCLAIPGGRRQPDHRRPRRARPAPVRRHRW